MQENVKFYILIHTYERPSRSVRAVQSVLSQSYSNYEVIIYNDGSTQDYGVLEHLVNETNHASQLTRQPIKFTYIHNAKNKGANHAKNILLDMMASRPMGGVHDYFFILDDDDYLTESALLDMSQQILEFPEQDWLAFDVYSNSPEVKQNNKYVHEYQKLTYTEYRHRGMYDDHFVWKRISCQNFRYPNRFFKNGYEHLYYFDLPFEIMLLPNRVKVIEYYDDGLTKSKRCNVINTLPNIVRHIALRPKEKQYYFWLYQWFAQYTLIGDVFVRLPKRLARSIKKRVRRLLKR